MTKPNIKAPPHLRPTTRKWWLAVCGEWELEDHHKRLLTLAGEAWDRCCQARAAIDEHGQTYTDRFGVPRVRPEIAIERDSRLAFARLLRELCLDQVSPPEGRPPRVGGSRY
jgi:phage terminase small subunit